MGLLFKVLSGPHQGAEVDILEDEITIGASDECDVIISDALVANRHMKLKVAEEGVFITSLEGNVFVSGKLLREPSTVNPFQFITIGTTNVMFGEDNSEYWKSIVPGNFPELEKIEWETSISIGDTEIANQETTEGKESDKAKMDKMLGAQNIEAAELMDRDIEKTSQPKKTKGSRLTVRQRIIRYSVELTMCFIIAAVFSTVKVFFAAEKQVSVPPPTLEQRVQKAIDELKLKAKIKVKISKVGDGPVSVVGYIDTMANSVEVKSALKSISEDISVKLLVMEKILSSAMEIVKESKQNVTLKQAEEFGEIIAMGYIKKEEIWTKLKESIASTKGIANIKDEVLTKTSVIELAKLVLERHTFKDNLEITATEDGVDIKGTISDRDKDRWTKAREDFEKTFKKKAQINFSIAISTDRNLTAEKFFGGKIDSVNFSNQGLDWVNIKNGNKYFQGSVLPSGYVIDQIEQHSVTIRNASEVIKIDLEWM